MFSKKYVANNFEEIEEMITQDLGNNAVILSSKQIKFKGIKSLFFSDQVEVIVAAKEDNLDNVNKILTTAEEWESPQLAIENSSHEKIKLEEGLVEPAQYEQSNIPGTYLDPRFNRKQLSSSSIVTALSSTNVLDSTLNEIKDFSIALANYMENANPMHQIRQNVIEPRLIDLEKSENSRLKERLLSKISQQGLSKEIGQKITENLSKNRNLQELDEIQFLKKEIKNLISIDGPLMIRKGIVTKVAFAGFSGSGKTTALLKIALQYQDELGLKVGIMAYDQNNEHLKIQCQQVHLFLILLNPQQSVSQEIEKFKELDLILIDTPFQEWMAEVNFEKMEQLQIMMTLACHTRLEEALFLIEKLAKGPAIALLFTKLDETLSYNLIVNICYRTQLPIAYLSYTASLLEKISLADPDEIAALTLSESAFK